MSLWRLMISTVLIAPLLLAGCASYEKRPARAPADPLAAQLLRAERSGRPTARQLADYLRVAEAASVRLTHERGGRATDDPALAIYNRAVADFAAGWSGQNRPLQVRDDLTGRTFVLTARQTAGEGWPPGYFQALENARTVKQRGFWQSVSQPGLGGTLVGIHRDAPEGSTPPPLEPPRGFRVPVTAVLSFQKGAAANQTRVVLQFLNPRVLTSVGMNGQTYPLAGDFTAAVASYPTVNETWAGFIGMVRGQKMAGRSGLYMLEPYDPNRIPVVLIHGLLASGFTWRNVGNELQADPEIRRRYQFWLFFYPTGNPILASALRLREDLALAQQRYGLNRGIVLIGHSMGGIISRLQVTDMDRSSWEAADPERAKALFAIVDSHPLLKRALIFRANPRVKRVIFICTPHRGSSIASGGLGALGDRVIRLPVALVQQLPRNLVAMADPKARVPTSIDNLSPKAPLLRVMAPLPIHATHHSIIGDRGRGNTPNSSDGVVPYWSSHLPTASSERIVPTGHGAMSSPLTIAEIRRILRLHAGLEMNDKHSSGNRTSLTPRPPRFHTAPPRETAGRPD